MASAFGAQIAQADVEFQRFEHGLPVVSHSGRLPACADGNTRGFPVILDMLTCTTRTVRHQYGS